MERLTSERNTRTWKLFQIGWYVNVVFALLSFFLALFFFSRMWHGYASNIAAGTTMTMAFVTIACVLLMGAGISRYQARLEGQHLELKQTIQKMAADLEAIRNEQKQSDEG
ncbi:MAG: hypothetical protein R6W89_08195 [Candidatus Hydrogenedentota bacterium]